MVTLPVTLSDPITSIFMSYFCVLGLHSPFWNCSSYSVEILYSGRPYPALAVGWQTTPKWAWSGSCEPFLNFGTQIISLEWMTLGISFFVQVGIACMIDYPQSGRGWVQGNVAFLIFGK